MRSPGEKKEDSGQERVRESKGGSVCVCVCVCVRVSVCVCV